MTEFGNLVDNQTLCRFLKWYLSNPLQVKAHYAEDKYSFKDCAYAKQYLHVAQHAERPIAFRNKLLELIGEGSADTGNNLADNHIEENGAHDLGLHGGSTGLSQDDIDCNQWSVKHYLNYLKKQTIIPFDVVTHKVKEHNEHAKKLAAKYDEKIRYYYPIVKKEYDNKIAEHKAHLHHFYRFKKIMHFGYKDVRAIRKIQHTWERISSEVKQFLHAKITEAQFGYDINLDIMRIPFEQGCLDDDNCPVLLNLWDTEIVNHHIWAHPEMDKDGYTTKDIVQVKNPLSKLAVYALLKYHLNFIFIKNVKPAPCFKTDANLNNVLDVCINRQHHSLTDPKIMYDYKKYVTKDK